MLTRYQRKRIQPPIGTPCGVFVPVLAYQYVSQDKTFMVASGARPAPSTEFTSRDWYCAWDGSGHHIAGTTIFNGVPAGHATVTVGGNGSALVLVTRCRPWTYAIECEGEKFSLTRGSRCAVLSTSSEAIGARFPSWERAVYFDDHIISSSAALQAFMALLGSRFYMWGQVGSSFRLVVLGKFA